MKATLMIVLLGGVLGWFVTGTLMPSPNEIAELKQAASRSLLSARGPSAETPMPDDASLRSFDGTADWIGQMVQAPDADLKRWILECTQGQSHRRHAMALIAELARRDPEAALQFVTDNDLNSQSSILAIWVRQDQKAALQAALRYDPNGYTAGRMITDLDLSDRKAFYQLLLDEGFDKQYPGPIGNILAELAEVDVVMAADEALKQTVNADRDRGLGRVIGKWLQQDPDALLAWAGGQTDSKVRQKALLEVSKQWMKEQPVEALEQFWDTLPNDQERSRMVMGLQGTPPDQIDAVLAWADEHVESLPLHGEIVSRLLGGLRSTCPEKLPDFMDRLDPNDWNTERRLTEVSRAWAEKDLDGLVAWMETIENPKLKQAVHQGWLSARMNEAPGEALEALAQMDLSSRDASFDFEDSLETLFKRLPSLDKTPTEVIGMLPEDLRDQASMAYAEAAAERKPEEVLEVLLEQPSGKDRDRGIAYASGHLAYKDPLQAAAWAADLEDSETKGYVMANVAYAWAQQDPEQALAWVEAQPEGVTRDRSIAQLVTAIHDDAPERALALAQSMAEGRDRTTSLTAAIQALGRQSPEQAENVLQDSTGLTAKETATLQAELALMRHLATQATAGE